MSVQLADTVHEARWSALALATAFLMRRPPCVGPNPHR